MTPPERKPDPFARLRGLTEARIGLGRCGQGLPTAALLDFQFAHALARDAVHAPLDVAALRARLEGPSVVVRSRAADRADYLRRPDQGRRLAPECVASLEPGGADVALVIADGLSATAVAAHAPAMAAAVQRRLEGLSFAPVVVATGARVALGDEIGEALGAKVVVVLIGERPGLSAADNLSAYVTWAPRVGRADSERNCVSNIREGGGLPIALAAEKVAWIVRQALGLKLTGVGLKERLDSLPGAAEMG